MPAFLNLAREPNLTASVFEVDIWKRAKCSPNDSIAVWNTELPTFETSLPPIERLVGEIKIKYAEALLGALKKKARQLEAHLVISTLYSTSRQATNRKNSHPLWVLLDGISACISLNSCFAINGSHAEQLAEFVNEQCACCPRLWLVMIAHRFSLHRSKSEYVAEALRSLEPVMALQSALSKGSGQIMDSVHQAAHERPADIRARVSKVLDFYGRHGGKQGLELNDRLQDSWDGNGDLFTRSLSRLEALMLDARPRWFFDKIEQMYPDLKAGGGKGEGQ